MVEDGNMTDIGKIFVDSKGAGRIYIPKRLMKKLDFQNRDLVIIRAFGNKLEILKLEEVL